MIRKLAKPIDAAAIILLDSSLGKVLWARRNPKLKFLGGFHSFPGGKVDESDSLSEVRNSTRENAKYIACAVRELFEEVGVLLVRNGDKLTSGQIVSLHDDLISGRNTFAGILDLWGLWIDAEDFKYTGVWTTPEFSPIRFKTHFFLARCPPKQKPYPAITELQEIEFIDPKEGIDQWAKSKVLIAPPVLISLKELAENKESKSVGINAEEVTQKLVRKSADVSGDIYHIELNSRLICFPLKTKTLPPATHTNCFIVGKEEFVVIDSATTSEDELRKLIRLIDGFIEKGYACKEIIVSHLHKDHFGGETKLRQHLRDKFEIDVPISAHRITIESLEGIVEFDRAIQDNQTYKLKDRDGGHFELVSLHTPGHARGHLCFYDHEFGFLLSSDNIVGQGTVVIAPPEGNMIDYFESLERMKNLENLNFICGSHGAAIYDGKGKIEEYIKHRLDREEQVLQIAENNTLDHAEIAAQIYDGLDDRLMPLAIATVEAHLEKLSAEGRIGA